MRPAALAAGVPIMVDAASEALTLPERWTTRGADMVVYSISKLMRGPAASGLLLGRKPLVQAAWYNGPPHQGFGRAMKISKEQIVGAVAAVELWLSHDRATEQRLWHTMLDGIRDRLQPINALRRIPDDGETIDEFGRHRGRLLRIAAPMLLHVVALMD